MCLHIHTHSHIHKHSRLCLYRLQHVSAKVAEVDEELGKHLSITERAAQVCV